LSSAFLYIAIVAIWAFVLIPRWLRRPHVLGGESTDRESTRQDASAPHEVREFREFREFREYREVVVEQDDEADAPAAAHDGLHDGPYVTAAPTAARKRVLRSRRRLLIVLATLMVLAAACTYLKLTSWVMCVPPAVMLGLYLLLLRESALADAQQARSREAEEQRTQATRHRVHHVQPANDTAQVIDISDRLGDQLYDQYADATMRAVGD
jgi:hypothetical protein